VPTTRSKLDVNDLDDKHMAWLSAIFENGVYENAVMPSSVVTLMRGTGIFTWIPKQPLRVEGSLDVVRDKGNKQITYQMYHLSCYGWQKQKLQRQIEQVRDMIARKRNRVSPEST
jgi:hypothetical protein